MQCANPAYTQGLNIVLFRKKCNIVGKFKHDGHKVFTKFSKVKNLIFKAFVILL
jgi:hypothetical protein